MSAIDRNNGNQTIANLPPVEANADCCCIALIKKIGTAVADFFTWIILSIYNALTSFTHAVTSCCKPKEEPIAGNSTVGNSIKPAGINEPTEDELLAIADAADAEQLEEEAKQNPPNFHGDDNGGNIGALIGAFAGAIFNGNNGEPLVPVNNKRAIEPMKPVVKPLKPEPLIEVANPSTEAMELKKLAAIKRLDELSDDKLVFELNPKVLEFDLDAALAKYSPDRSTNKFLDLFDYANPGKGFTFGDQRELFINKIVKEYPSNNKTELPQYKAVRESLSRLGALFELKQTRFKENIDQENALKQQIRYTITRLLDASKDCVDQVLAQLEHILVESIASESRAGVATPEEQLQARAAAILYQYKSNLITTTVQNLFPKSKHQADIERAVKKEVGPFIGLNASINTIGGLFDKEWMMPNKKEKIELARRAVLRRYNKDLSFIPIGEKDHWKGLDERPLAYVLREAKASEQYNPVDPLRSSLLNWGITEFDLEGEDHLTPNLVNGASEDAKSDITMYGPFNQAGLLWLLEASGIIQEVKSTS